MGESGEIAEKIKKHLRNPDAQILDLYNDDELFYEIGDLLYYVARLAFELGFYFEDIARANIKKLEARHKDRL